MSNHNPRVKNEIQNRLTKPAQQSVHPTGGTLRVFRQFSWLEPDSGKMALSRPAHQRVTQTVSLLSKANEETTAGDAIWTGDPYGVVCWLYNSCN
jgi:hypothetical protein